MPKLTRWRKASTSACSAARDRTNPRSVARSEIGTDITAARAYPVVSRNFNGVSSVGVFSRHSPPPRSTGQIEEVGVHR